MKSIGTKLIVVFATLFIAIVALVATVLIVLSSSSIKNLTISDMSSRMALQAREMEELFTQRSSFVEMTAEILVSDGVIDPEYIQSIITPIYEANESYNLYVAFSDNQAFFADKWEPDESWHATERDWYKLGEQNPGEVISSTPYVDSDTGEICVTLSYGMVRDGKVIGVTALDIYQADLYNPILNSKYIKGSEYIMLLDVEGFIYYHPDKSISPSVEGGIKNLKTMDSGKYQPIFDNMYNNIPSIITNYAGNPCYFVTATIDHTDWVICGAVTSAELQSDMVRQIWLAVLISLASLLIVLVIVFFVVRKMIIVPINHMVEAALVMSTGDIEVKVDTDANDELGQFGRAFQTIVEDTKSNAGAIRAIAEGDLTHSINVRSDKDVIGLALSTMLDSNNEVISKIMMASNHVSDCSKQIADVGQSLAAGSQEQSGAVERLSVNVSQISEMSNDNLQLSESAEKLSDDIIENAEQGSAKMTEMLKAVSEISEASRAIETVIHTIDNIAFQTNILALNAAVEAARAGQHGKGFAVVAEEVRSLASKSAEAAKNTSALISNSMEKAELGLRLAGQTAASFEKIVDGVHDSTKKIKEISTFSGRQVSAISAIAEELKDVSRVAQQNSASAEETASAGEEMNGESVMLQEMTGRFKIRQQLTSGK